RIINLFPDPNQNLEARIPSNNFLAITSGRQQNDQGDIRIDHKLSDADSLFGSLSWSNEDKNNTTPLPERLDSTAHSLYNLGRNAMLSYTRVWNPRILSESRVAFSRLVAFRTPANAD